jgi:hypothetical protein
MELQLTDKRILVTGSNSGLGKAMVEFLAAEGAIVIVHGRDEARTEAVADDHGRRRSRHAADQQPPAVQRDAGRPAQPRGVPGRELSGTSVTSNVVAPGMIVVGAVLSGATLRVDGGTVRGV